MEIEVEIYAELDCPLCVDNTNVWTKLKIEYHKNIGNICCPVCYGKEKIWRTVSGMVENRTVEEIGEYLKRIRRADIK